MSKKRDNLDRLYIKLRERYGAEDVLTLQVKHELDTYGKVKGKTSKSLMSYSEFIKSTVVDYQQSTTR